MNVNSYLRISSKCKVASFWINASCKCKFPTPPLDVVDPWIYNCQYDSNVYDCILGNIVDAQNDQRQVQLFKHVSINTKPNWIMTPLGSIKPDKSIVRVWIKVKEWIVLEQVSCSQLEIEPIDSRDTKLRYMPHKQ